MINPELTKIESLAIHRVGNKLNDEGIQFSKSLLTTNEEINQILISYFISSFKVNEFYNFNSENELTNNKMYSIAQDIFDSPGVLFDKSIEIAERLYEFSVHPKIKQGELCIVYFNECLIEDETVDAIGIFKSEIKEKYLRIHSRDDNFEIQTDDGININKLDKGCLIFNTEKEHGYKLCIIDNLNRGSEAQYWKDEFLQIVQRKDDFYFTQNTMTLCKSFFTEHLPEEYNITKADQADLLNRSVKFLKEKESFSVGEFADEVLQESELKEDFNNYKAEFENNFDIKMPERFEISESAVKLNSKVFKSVIKLDKNFHIYVHGKREYIIKGYDEKTGMNYYQLFYKEEK